MSAGSSVVTHAGPLGPRYRCTCASRLFACTRGSAAVACAACDGEVGDEVRLSAAEQLAALDLSASTRPPGL